MDKVLKQLNVVYYLTLLGGPVVFGLLGYWLAMRRGVHVDALATSGVVLTSVLILYAVVMIPLTLFLFHKRCRRLKEQPNTPAKVLMYKRMSVVRLLIIGVALWAGILTYYLTAAQSMLYLAGMAAIMVFMCKPGEARMTDDIEHLDDVQE